MIKPHHISSKFAEGATVVVYEGNCLDLLKDMPADSQQLVVTSPPYNVGKSYENRQALDVYLEQQRLVIEECVRVLSVTGSLCWQVGNFVDKKGASSIVPLDLVLYPVFASLGLKLRNRIIWHFEHGLHCTNRFSGRYETILWFTKSDDYYFNLDPVRVPQKYPGKKHFRGPKAGQYSCNPLGKNPGDLWVIPNVKSNHVEKTIHPCQFPIELVERLILSMTEPGDWVFDPYMGAGSSLAAAVKHGRRAAGADMVKDYVQVTKDRIGEAWGGTLRARPMNKPVYDPHLAGNKLTVSPWPLPQIKIENKPEDQMVFLEPAAKYRSRMA